MNFAEIRFWGWLMVGLVAIMAIRLLLGRWTEARLARFDRCALAVLGLFLLACVSVVTVVIFLVVALGTYVGLRWLIHHDVSRHRWYVAVLIPLQLLPLAYYKYADFICNQALGLEFSTLRQLVIPVGISFYSFQMVAFVLDTLAFKRPLPGFLDFLNFAGFFPQIVAGPIERRDNLLPQMERYRFRWNAEDVNAGAAWIVLGLFFKLCLADNMALYFHGRSLHNAYLIWLDNVLFGLRIYYDFAGYSLVALGVGRCLGIRLTLNFQSPYVATSIGEFWRRWHITLSQWFRDYVYVPLGGSRTPRWWFNVAVVFIVSGIWHGAGWNFMWWGALHGFYLIVNRLWSRRGSLPGFIGWGLTLMAAMLAWLGFYETSTANLMTKLRALVSPTSYAGRAWAEALTARSPADTLVMACLLVLVGMTLAAEWWSIRQKREPYEFLRRPVVLMILIVLTVLLAPGTNNAFIYFAF